MTLETSKTLRVGTLIDGTGRPAQHDVAIDLTGDKITGIEPWASHTPTGHAEQLDFQDLTLLPGLVDAHMHFFGVPSNQLHQLPTEQEAYRALRAAGEAKAMLRSGITSARCLGSSIGPSLRRALAEGHIPGPRLVAAGEFICSTNGTWDHISFPIEQIRGLGMLADGVDACREIVRRRAREGATVIKVGMSQGTGGDTNHPWGDEPTETIPAFSPEEVQMLTSEAHANNLKVSAHCIGDAPVASALENGVDIIEHGHGISEETRRRIVDSGTIVVSTISQLEYHRLAAKPFHYSAEEARVFQRHLDVMRAEFERNLEAGVRYALGSDLIGYPTHPQDHAPREFELAVEWGMSPDDAIQAGTRVGSETLSMEDDIGTVEVGKYADFIAVSGDPFKDITLLQDVQTVIQGGEIVS